MRPCTSGSFTIYDPSTAPGGFVRFKDILSHVESRLHLSRAFCQKLVHVPLNLDHPYWVEDDEFDLEFHVRHIALPKPGDWRQLCIQAARLHSRPLDFNKPLWEMYVIEGLDNVDGVPPGSFAVLLKIHHSMIDGVSGSEITEYIHDTEPDPANKPTVQPWEPEPAPSAAELLARAQINTLFQPLRFFEVVSRSMPGLARASQGLMRRALRTTGASKALTNAVGARNLADYSRFIPSQLAGLAARLSTSAEMRALTERAVPAINTVVTNVPGPQTPLYFAGAEALNFVGLGPVYDGMALIHPVFSYCGRLAISFTSCRETLPDPERYADMLQASFEALQAAAGRAGPAGDSASAAGTRPAVA